MALLYPGIGNIGSLVTGENMSFSISDSQTGHVAKISIPSPGIWLVTASGWAPSFNPSADVYGEVILKNLAGFTLATCGVGGYTFSVTGIETVTSPGTEYLDINNRTGSTISGSSISNLKYYAVKIGDV